MVEGAEPAQTIIERHDDDAMLRQFHAVIDRKRGPAEDERTAIDPYHHGQFRARRIVGRPDIERQAVLALRQLQPPGQIDLRTDGPEGAGIAHAAPAGSRLRRAPTERSHRGRRKGNTLEDAGGAFGYARKRALRDPGLRLCPGGQRGQAGQSYGKRKTAH